MSTDSTKLPTRFRILLLGSNPSIRSQTDLAFYNDTKSGSTLNEWIKDIDATFYYANVSHIKTENNRQLTKKEVRDSLPSLMDTLRGLRPDKIVALGKVAADALTLLRSKIEGNLEWLEMPHPSGLNRKLNDPNYRDQKIKELAAYCEPSRQV